jgi:hypothetical protein
MTAMAPALLNKADIITPAQCRAAGALINMRQDILAELGALSKLTLNKFDTGKHVPGTLFLTAIRAALEAEDVVLIDQDRYGRGVRLLQRDVDLHETLSLRSRRN